MATGEKGIMFKEYMHETNGGCSNESFIQVEVMDDSPVSDTDKIYIDAGTRHLRLQACSPDGSVHYDKVVPSNSDLHDVLSLAGLINADAAIADPARIGKSVV